MVYSNSPIIFFYSSTYFCPVITPWRKLSWYPLASYGPLCDATIHDVVLLWSWKLTTIIFIYLGDILIVFSLAGLETSEFKAPVYFYFPPVLAQWVFNNHLLHNWLNECVSSNYWWLVRVKFWIQFLNTSFHSVNVISLQDFLFVRFIKPLMCAFKSCLLQYF